MARDDRPHKISYCTTCKGRLHHLKETLPANLAAEAGNPNVEFVVLDYGSDDGLGDWIRQNFAHEIETGRLRYARSEQEYFRMAHAKNMAHRLATGDILCNLDADNFVPQYFSKWLGEQFDREPHAIVTTQAIGHLDLIKERTGRVLRGLPPTMEIGGIGGRIAVRKEDFYRLGGYNEKIEGWGPDDLQFALRACDAGLRPVNIPPHQIGGVIAHDAESRVKELSPEARAESERLIHRPAVNKFASAMIRRSTRYETVANNGEFGCGDVTINFGEQQRIEPPRAGEQQAEVPERKTDWALTTGQRGQSTERS